MGDSDGAFANSRHRRRRLHRPPPRDLPQITRPLGARRRPEGTRVLAHRRRRVRDRRPPRGRRLHGDDGGSRPGVRTGGRHGRDGLHLVSQRRDPALQRADQPAHGGGGAAQPRQPLPLHLVGVHLPGVPAGGHGCPAAARGGCLPGPAAGRLRLGEARGRAPVPLLPRGLRPRDAHRPLPQHLRSRSAPGRAAARRRPPRCAARWPWPSTPATRGSRSGATACRRARSATSTTASRASTG